MFIILYSAELKQPGDICFRDIVQRSLKTRNL